MTIHKEKLVMQKKHLRVIRCLTLRGGLRKLLREFGATKSF